MPASYISAYKCTTTFSTCFSVCQHLKKPLAIFGSGSILPKGACSKPAPFSFKLVMKGSQLMAVRAERERPSRRDMKVTNSLAELVQVMQHAEEGGSHQKQQDWRAFRAALNRSSSSSSSSSSSAVEESTKAGKETAWPSIWAHKLVRPEEGCLLMATHHLDSHPLLQKSIVLLTQAPHPQHTTWTGHLINKPLPYPIADVVGIGDDVALGLARCPAFLGGSLLTASTSSIHSMTASPLCGHHPLLPGLHIGSGDTALLAAWAGIQQQIIKPSQVRVLVGHLEWHARTLIHEVEVLEWWSIVSCPSSLLLQNVNSMWEALHSVLETN